MRAMGIDIGTTSISLIMIDGETGKMLGKTGIAHRVSGAPAVSDNSRSP